MTHRYDAYETAIAVGAEAANVIRVTITARRKEQAAQRLVFRMFLSDNVNGEGIAAVAPSGGFAVGTKGKILAEEVANLIATVQTDVAGAVEIDITEVAVKTFYLVMVQPTGEMTIAKVTFA